MIGTLLNGRYRLEGELGGGGMGRVYRAHDTLLDRHVAVKVLSPSGLGTKGRAHLLREAQAAAGLNHPNIVSVYDAGEAEVPGSAGTVPFIVMELVEGDSLHDCPPGSLDEILDIACQVCTALDHAHAHGVIHRDLKPENVLLLPDGSARLVDFGLARTMASRLTAGGAILGTVLYIAPEQALGQEIDGRADLYTLGVMLYEWTTGRLPFAGDDPVALIGQHLQAPVVPPREHNPEIPLALDALIVQLMSKRREERPASAAEVRQVLETLVQEPAARELPPDGPRQPAFLTGAEEGMVERPAFVAREHELAWLGHRLDAALAGQGGVVFVTGGPGRGKTALLDVFARQAMDKHDELLVASGNCNAYSGVGDPYLPFREVLDMLSGDVEAPWVSGAISRDHALRLWGALPLAVQALLDHGPHVVPSLLPGPALLSRAVAVAPPGAPWLQRLTERVERQAAHSDGMEQSHLFQQVTNLLRTLAEAHPLLLILDDLQWIDAASAGLLFHLGRRLEGHRILVVGTYRPEEVALGRAGERHPLEAVLAEFKRAFGDVWLDLAEVPEPEGRHFVDALLETEPHCLGESFRRALFAHTAGHPLFTVELLRTMQERGDLVQDEGGRWVEGPALDWETLPARVEGVIEARIGRLEPELREILSVASVEGEEFTAQVVARVQGLGERQALQRLSRELEARHRLVREGSALRLGRQRLSRYRFAHTLFQQYLCNHLGDGERALLHGEVAAVLESLYEDHPEGVAAIAPQLARHFAEAGDDGRAVAYLILSGDGALAGYANREAEAYYRRALDLAPGESERAHLLSGLGEALFRQGCFREAIRAWGEGIERYAALEDSNGLARLYARSSRAAGEANDPAEALRLCLEGLNRVEGAPEGPGLARLLYESARAYASNALGKEARSFELRSLEMAERLGDVELQAHALVSPGRLGVSSMEDRWGALARAAELAESHGLLDAASRAHVNLATLAQRRHGDCRTAREHLRRAGELGGQAGDTAGQVLALAEQIWNSTLCGELEEAGGTLSEARALLRDLTEPSRAKEVVLEIEQWYLLYRGDWAECTWRARARQTSARQRGADLGLAFAGWALAYAVLESNLLGGDASAGTLQEAEAALAEAIEIFDRSLDIHGGITTRTALSWLRVTQGRLSEARQLLTEAKQKATQELALPEDEAILRWLEGQVACTEGRWAEALAAHEAAAELVARHGLRWDWARFRLDWAEAHAARGEPGDRERAVELLRESLAAFEEMGIPRYAAVAQQRLDELEVD
jgi:adenylate cyclase